MLKIIEDLIHAGLGLGKVTREKAEKIFNELKEKGELEEKDREIFITRTIEKLEKAGKEITEKVRETINPTQKKIEELNKKIDELVAEVKKMKEKKEK